MKRKILKLLGKEKEKGIFALFETADNLLSAIRKAREHRITKMEAYSPYPVHGIEGAMGLKRSWIPWVTLVMALTGFSLGFIFQAWTSAVSWPINVGGKPFISWPAFIPVTFEAMVLIGGISTVLILFAACKLPNLFRKPLDARLTDDHFGLFVDSRDPQFDGTVLGHIFKECDAKEVRHVE